MSENPCLHILWLWCSFIPPPLTWNALRMKFSTHTKLFETISYSVFTLHFILCWKKICTYRWWSLFPCNFYSWDVPFTPPHGNFVWEWTSSMHRIIVWWNHSLLTVTFIKFHHVLTREICRWGFLRVSSFQCIEELFGTIVPSDYH